ncbi:MAG TPA: PaaI family thioesterase [Castellaniella sp.]|uniref:PaaI family thioesterase n=1 Tax=Castellaniella sp. TaxID=1955812 RepID=UPI002EEBDEFC
MPSAASQAPDPLAASYVQQDFDHSGLMQRLGAQLTQVLPGEVHITLPYSEHLTQHLGYFHAGATSAIADAAGSMAARSLLPADQTVVSVEFKINLMAPAVGEALEAVGRVVRQGRTLTVTQVDVYALKGSERKPVALMQQTLFNLPQP